MSVDSTSFLHTGFNVTSSALCLVFAQRLLVIGRRVTSVFYVNSIYVRASIIFDVLANALKMQVIIVIVFYENTRLIISRN